MWFAASISKRKRWCRVTCLLFAIAVCAIVTPEIAECVIAMKNYQGFRNEESMFACAFDALKKVDVDKIFVEVGLFDSLPQPGAYVRHIEGESYRVFYGNTMPDSESARLALLLGKKHGIMYRRIGLEKDDEICEFTFGGHRICGTLLLFRKSYTKNDLNIPKKHRWVSDKIVVVSGATRCWDEREWRQVLYGEGLDLRVQFMSESNNSKE